ncbi:hypothetical protein D3C76_1439410 [compost metagenome]
MIAPLHGFLSSFPWITARSMAPNMVLWMISTVLRLNPFAIRASRNFWYISGFTSVSMIFLKCGVMWFLMLFLYVPIVFLRTTPCL